MKLGVMVRGRKDTDYLKSFQQIKEMGMEYCQIGFWDTGLYTDETANAIKHATEVTGVKLSTLWAGYRGKVDWNFTGGPLTAGLVPPAYRAGREEDLIAGSAFAEKLGFKLEMTDNAELVRGCLRTGGAVVVHSGGDREGYIGVFTHGGHYVTLINEEPDGRIAVLDPSYKVGKYEEEGRKGKVEVKNGYIGLCDLSVLAKDAENRSPGFYLFWRK